MSNQLNYSFFESLALSQKTLIPKELTIVEFIVGFLERAKLQGNNHLYDDPYLLVQLISGAQGSCFMHPADFSETDLNDLAGFPVLEKIAFVKPYLKVALLDAYYFYLNQLQNISPSKVVEYTGLAPQKSKERADYLVDLTMAKKGDNVLVIGVIDDIVEAFIRKGVNLKLADFARANTDILGNRINNDGKPYIDWADSLLVTGNTLKTDTLWEYLPKASNMKKRVVVYAMTGINIAPHYINYGANVVTTESFPYYWYANTISKMYVYQSKK